MQQLLCRFLPWCAVCVFCMLLLDFRVVCAGTAVDRGFELQWILYIASTFSSQPDDFREVVLLTLGCVGG